ncbi:hypothetical protein [Phyllobacterium lublinensis]|uniref:hypothetical protein n=1 Tax=Phyllobacterium lublinensis TaxID=2875708 RepID=UPI001CCABC9A|nr:hypothetical protein [Phyllobacterium sp. 2063]MBZ9654857.1 hypothetical protein [Phyllobacterium sp. 2063]
MDRYETFATWIFIVFGALIVGGLMSFGIVTDDKAAFLFALASACAAFFLGFAVIFDQPRLYGLILFVSIALIACSVTAIVT